MITRCLLKLKEKYSEKAECYICSNAGILVLWWFIGYLLMGKKSRLLSDAIGECTWAAILASASFGRSDNVG